MRKRSARLIGTILLMLVASPLAAQQPVKRLTITPTRIVVDTRERSGELTIMNIFSEAATYRVQLINNKMLEEGGYTETPGPLDPAFDPQQYVRLTPRQFRLEPGGSQRIRLSVRRPSDLPAGDYRFHVMVVRLSNLDNSLPEQKGITAGITANLGISIPVVVRQGAYNGDVKIEDVQINPPTATDSHAIAVVTVRHLGSSDIFGGVRIFWEPNGGEREQIGIVNNTNVFHELEKRKITFPLDKYPQGSGKLIVQYIEDFYKQGVIDETILDR